jgi:hypothetical protein
MRCHLGVELIAEDDHVVEFIRDGLLRRISGVPNTSFTQEIEAGSLDDTCLGRAAFCSEEHGSAEDTFKRGDQTAVFRTALLHAEGLQHLRGAPEADRLALLPHRQSGEKNEDDTILSVRYSELRMAGDLKDEVSIPALVQQLALR